MNSLRTNPMVWILCLAALTSCKMHKGTQDASIATSEMKVENSADKNIMLLGTYHFNNPGNDTYNIEVDDYSSEKRQAEIEEVVQLLAAYRPTKIFIEFLPEEQKRIDSLYTHYLNDEIGLNDIQGAANEVYQIGFRLGKKMNGIEIRAIDHSGNWLAPYADFLADTLALDYYNQNSKKQELQLEKNQALFTSNTVRENLIYLNNCEQIKKKHDYYNNVAIQVQDTTNVLFSYQESEMEFNGFSYYMRSFDFNNIGVELVAEWYKRNLFIYRNILENTQKEDRVVVLIGSGHVNYLNQLLKDNPDFNIVDVNQYLGK